MPLTNSLPDSGKDSYADSLEDLPAAAKTLAADSQPLTVLVEGDIMKCSQILLDIRSLKIKISFLKSCAQFLSKKQGKEAAEHMTPDGFICLMIDGPCFKG